MQCFTIPAFKGQNKKLKLYIKGSKAMKAKILLVGLMAVCCMTACSNDNDEQPIGGKGSKTEGNM